MSENPVFSIVTVSLNAGDDLIRTAESVRSQDFEDYEYVIKDGCSEKESLELAKKVGADKFEVKQDKGIFDGMNQALELCSGRYIIFINAGDLFYDNHVLSVVAKFIRDNPQVEFVYGDSVGYYCLRTFVIYPNRIRRFFLYSNTVCHQTWFVKKKIYEELKGFDTSYPIGGDYLFLLKLFLVRKAIAAHVKYFVVVYKPGGLSSDPILSKESERRREAVRRQLYHPIECFLYSKVLKLRNVLKPVIYDTGLFRLYRLYGNIHKKIRERKRN